MSVSERRLPRERAPARLHYAWPVLAVGTLVVFGALGLARFGYTMLLPPMQAALDLDNTQAGALATANLVGYLAMTVIGGARASHVGPRIVIALGLAVAALGMLLTGLAETFGAALGWRALTGIGSGASNVPVMALLSAWFVQRRRGLAAGIGVTGSSLALILLGPLVPRLLADHGEDGWRLCWFGFAGLTLLIAILALLVLRNRPGTSASDPWAPRTKQRRQSPWPTGSTGAASIAPASSGTLASSTSPSASRTSST